MDLKKIFLLLICIIIQFNIVYAETSSQPYYSSIINQYNNIVFLYNKINKNSDNITLYYEYIKTVENYLNNYGKTSLNNHSKKNYIFIMQQLGIAYEKTLNINKAITTFESLSYDYPVDINLSKHLLYLYDKTNSCSKALSTYNKIKSNEPNFNYTFAYCKPTIRNQVFNNINNQPEKISHKVSLNNIKATGSLSNVKPAQLNDNPNTTDNYNWGNVYITFFGLWGYIFFIAFSKYKDVDEQTNLHNSYTVKYKNYRPIKPTLYEFNFNENTYNEIDKIIQTKSNLNVFTYPIPAISMCICSMLFNAPCIIFPIFYKVDCGLFLLIIFYIFALIAISSIQEEYIVHKNKEAIQNYYNYNKAILLYKAAEERAYWQQRSYWEKLSPFAFEEAIGKLFEYLGYRVNITQKSRDGGIDILIKRGNTIKGIQCKQYKSKVGVKEVRELWGVKDCFKLNNEVLKLDGVILVALSGVSKDGYEFISMCQEYELWTIDTIIAKANNASYQYRFD